MNSTTLPLTAMPEPQLAAPGAGLPFVEKQVAYLLFTLRRRTTSRAQFTAEFIRERDEILRLAASCPPESAAIRVLVNRIPGMEDSSRYWSIWMTLEHLRLVNTGIAEIIRTLAAGRTPQRPASTADVKPSRNADASAVEGFIESCQLVLDAGAAPELKTKLRFAHPWFGPLNAESWYALTAFHQQLHRRQIEQILAGLPR
jgi:hypothetical protein